MLTLITIILLIIGLIGVFVGMAPWRKVAGYEKWNTEGYEAPENNTFASIVAYVHRDEENLTEYADTLLNQDYKNFEVILVCDASAEATSVLSDKFEGMENLHITFIPPGSHHLSRRKLAQTLGIKRAKGDVVITTSTSVKPRSNKWLSLMMVPFKDSDCDVVCGYVHTAQNDYSGFSRWYRQFDATLTCAQWMAEAIEENPYRGDGYNLAFRRKLFFEAKGYASTLTLMDGDDDVFINEICNRGKGRMMLNPDSIVDTCREDETDRIHIDLKDRYTFTRKFLPKAPFVRAGVLAAINWLMAGAVAMVVVSLIMLVGYLSPVKPGESFGGGTMHDDFAITMLTLSIVNFIIFIAFVLTEILSYRRLATRLGNTRLFWGVYPFMLWRPIGNFLFFLNHFPQRRSHYTWTKS